MDHDNFREQRNISEGSLVFPDGMLQTKIRVPFLQNHRWYQFQAFAGVFRKMELICTTGKRHSGTKFTNPEFCLPFTQTVNRLGCPNGKQPLILIQPLLFCYVNDVVLMLTSLFKHNFHEKRFVSKHGQTQPPVHSKARILSSQL